MAAENHAEITLILESAPESDIAYLHFRAGQQQFGLLHAPAQQVCAESGLKNFFEQMDKTRRAQMTGGGSG